MPPKVLYAGVADDWPKWSRALSAATDAVGLDIELMSEASAPETIDYIVYAPEGPVKDFEPFTKLKAILSLWAGVETIVGNRSINAPLCRMTDAGMREGMTDYVVAHVMRHHVGLDRHLKLQPGEWPQDYPPVARKRRVGVMGLGALGADAAEKLAQLRFNVMGWSRSPKEVPGVNCQQGEDGLREILSHSHILVLMLPLTPATENLIETSSLSRLPRGAVIINTGRGPLIDDRALLEALDSGQIGHATLDVFRREPLPDDHPFWTHPNVTITPHIAAVTREDTAAEFVLENIRRGEAGEPFLSVVDLEAGY